jgi:hypothetical protein
MPEGYIYILINAAMSGYLKIGMTTRSPHERAHELSQASGVVAPFVIAYSERVVNCEAAENRIHTRLARFRVNGRREFFHLPVQDAILELIKIADEVGRSVPTAPIDDLAPTEDGLVSTAVDTKLDPADVASLSQSRSADCRRAEQEAIDELREDSRKLYLEMKTRATAFGPDVETYATPQYLAFKAGKKFAEIAERETCLSVLIRRDAFPIPEKAKEEVLGLTAYRYPNSHGWSCSIEFKVDGSSLMGSVESLLRQSYRTVAVKGVGRNTR